MDNSTLSSRFRSLREVLGISQGEMARAVEKTASFIQLIEVGKSKISEDTLTKVCRAYHVNPAWLQSGEGDMFEPGYETAPPDRAGIPQRIKSVRKEQKLTQAGLAEEIGCSKSQLAAVEQGTTNPSNELLKKIAARCGINYRWLLTGTGGKTDENAEKKAGMAKIYEFFSEDQNARAVVLEAIQEYSVGRDPAVWDRIKETLREKEK